MLLVWKLKLNLQHYSKNVLMINIKGTRLFFFFFFFWLEINKMLPIDQHQFFVLTKFVLIYFFTHTQNQWTTVCIFVLKHLCINVIKIFLNKKKKKITHIYIFPAIGNHAVLNSFLLFFFIYLLLYKQF